MKAFLTFVLCTCFSLMSVAQTGVQMTNTEFNQLLRAETENLRSLDASSGTDMGDRLATAANYFSTAQVRKLLSVIERDSGKLALARALYNRVTDKTNFGQLADLFELNNYRTEFTLWYNNPDKDLK